jgi:hypothetical protein
MNIKLIEIQKLIVGRKKERKKARKESKEEEGKKGRKEGTEFFDLAMIKTMLHVFIENLVMVLKRG